MTILDLEKWVLCRFLHLFVVLTAPVVLGQVIYFIRATPVPAVQGKLQQHTALVHCTPRACMLLFLAHCQTQALQLDRSVVMQLYDDRV
jgi:hypothetical protein